MNLNILCPVDNIEFVRNNIKSYWPESTHTYLNTGLSPTGKLPVTHWYCNFVIKPENLQKYLDMQTLSIITTGDSKEFLKTWGLKPIKS